MRFKQSKDGTFYRELEFSGEDKPRYQRVDPVTQARLESQYGKTSNIIDEQTQISAIQEDKLKELIRETNLEMMRGDLEQKRKDDASLQDQKEGGGVIRYQPDFRKSISIYDDSREAIYDLYAQARKGDKEAESKLDALWKLAIPRLKELEKKGSISIVGCPKCGSGLDPDVGNCDICGWNMYDAGYSKEFGDILRGRKG